MVGASGVMVDPAKVDIIVRIPAPKNVTEVRGMVRLVSLYRKFSPNFSSIVSPFTYLLRKTAHFIWDTICETTFEAIRIVRHLRIF